MNPFLILSGIGMMLVGIIPVLYWWKTRGVSWRYFAWGGAVWLIAIAVKLAMDLTVTQGLVFWFSSLYPIFGVAVLTGVYVGIRTGLLESGFSYLAVLKTKLKGMKWNEAVAFGLGFGCAEAFLLGLVGTLSLAVILLDPASLQALPAGLQAAYTQQLNLPTLAVIPAIMERAFVVLAHLFASLLVVYSVITRKFHYLLYSIIYKTILDGMLPLLIVYVGTETLLSMYLIELPILFFGLVGLVGTYWMRDKFKAPEKAEPRPVRDVGILALVCVIIVAVGLVIAGLGVAEPTASRVVNLEGLEGRYDFMANGESIGSYDFQVTGSTTYKEQEAWHLNESASISAEGLILEITGSLYLSETANPLYYESEIVVNGESTLVEVEFSDVIKETLTKANSSVEKEVELKENTFIMANNMIGHWAVMFRSLDLGEGKTYTVNMFSPSIASNIITTLSVTGKEGSTFVLKDQLGQTHYVTQDGILEKIVSPGLEIVLSG